MDSSHDVYMALAHSRTKMVFSASLFVSAYISSANIIVGAKGPTFLLVVLLPLCMTVTRSVYQQFNRYSNLMEMANRPPYSFTIHDEENLPVLLAMKKDVDSLHPWYLWK